jgi:drug/metabolite transporter (DMT)-like permease
VRKKRKPWQIVIVTDLAVPSRKPSALRALLALVCTCALWGLSFPLMKVLGLHLSAQAPGISTWFVAATTVVVRFGSGMLLLALAGLARPTAAELKQACLLGLFSGAGMLLQMDALNFSPASTSAFLTQGYIMILPVVAAIGARAFPQLKTVICVLASASGLGVLSGFDWVSLRLGRGETETLMAACSFAVQILSLDSKAYRGNRPRVVTMVMFACITALLVPVALWTMRSASEARLLFATPLSLLLVCVLSVPCTVVAFSLMNRYQPDVSASEAGIIYGAEPLFASVFALFLPAFFARWAGVAYPNEQLTLRLLVGGGLVIAANVLLQISWSPFSAGRLSNAAGQK